jgi:hypothetical protein
MVEHPLITAMLTFVSWKFDGHLEDIDFNIVDASVPSVGSFDGEALMEFPYSLKVDVLLEDLLPVDMFLPGYPNIWRAQFLELLEGIDKNGMYKELMGRWTVDYRAPVKFMEEAPPQEEEEEGGKKDDPDWEGRRQEGPEDEWDEARFRLLIDVGFKGVGSPNALSFLD